MNGDWPGKFESFLPTKADGGGRLRQFVVSVFLVFTGVLGIVNVGGVMPIVTVAGGVVSAAFPVWYWVTHRRR